MTVEPHRFQHPQVREVPPGTVAPWILRAVAARGHMSTRNIAVSLGLPERTIEAARKELER